MMTALAMTLWKLHNNTYRSGSEVTVYWLQHLQIIGMTWRRKNEIKKKEKKNEQKHQRLLRFADLRNQHRNVFDFLFVRPFVSLHKTSERRLESYKFKSLK